MGVKLPREKLWEWIFRLAFIALMLYASANYLSIKEYRSEEARKAQQEEAKGKLLTDINMTLARIDERSKNDDTKLRVAELEKKVQEIDKRIVPNP